MPLCLVFSDLKKAFNTVETEAVVEALGNLGVSAQHVRMLHNILLIIPNIEQAEQMLAEFDNVCGKIGLRMNHEDGDHAKRIGT
ncbi:hypothetical protein V3C99_008699 [Haemonchus contortus]|uniref:Reverse transcriptase domain-containing protein n=1 Tax=Haemonchus contortus TaxID=6289 RepID=A0A7I4YN44_HAECO